MRQFAWYSPQHNVIVLQSFMQDCRIAFEWDINDMNVFIREFGQHCNPMEMTMWIPLGEL